MPTLCPERIRWQDLLDGVLPADDQTELAAHLESCDRCQQAMEALSAGTRSWSILDEPGDVRHTSDETALCQAIAQLKQHAWEVDFDAWSDARDRDTPLDFLDPATNPDSLGTFGRHEVLEVLGRGGMGIVLKALDPRSGQTVALKVASPQLAANSLTRRRFTREARIMATLKHPNIVAMHAVDEWHGLPHLVMEYVPGESLQARLDRDGTLPTPEIITIAQQTAEGLAYAHARGQVHRDIKPANILLGDRPSGIAVKLTDFGLARGLDDARLTQTGVVAGTPAYMSPEQARGEEVDARADLFSLGSVMYAMCTGRPPFRARNVPAVLRQVCERQPRPIEQLNPEVPRWLCDIIERLLEKDPALRFQSAAEVSAALRMRRTSPLPPFAQPAPDEPRPARLASRSVSPKWLFALAASVLLVPPLALLVRYAWPAGTEPNPANTPLGDGHSGVQPWENADAPPVAPGPRPKNLDKLRYAWKAGERYVYGLQVELDQSDAREIYSGTLHYFVAAADEAGFTLRASAGMSRWRAPRPGEIPRGGIGLMGMPNLVLSASPDLNEIRHDPFGRVVRQIAQVSLPFGLGDVVSTAIEPLDGTEQAWARKQNRVVVEFDEWESRSPLGFPLPSRVRPGGSIRSPLDPPPVRRSFEVRTVTTYWLGEKRAATRVIGKRLDERSVELVNNQPRWRLAAEGALEFDEARGIPWKCTLSGEKIDWTAGGFQRTPITFVYRLLEGEERERVLNPPPAGLNPAARAPEPKPAGYWSPW